MWQPRGCRDCNWLGYGSQPFLIGPHHEYLQMRKIWKQKSQKLFWTETHFHSRDVTWSIEYRGASGTAAIYFLYSASLPWLGGQNWHWRLGQALGAGQCSNAAFLRHRLFQGEESHSESNSEGIQGSLPPTDCVWWETLNGEMLTVLQAGWSQLPDPSWQGHMSVYVRPVCSSLRFSSGVWVPVLKSLTAARRKILFG